MPRKSAHVSAARADQAAREQLRALFEQASDGLFLADIDGRYTDVNAAGCAMLGYTRDEIVGKTILDLIPAEEVERLLQSRTEMLGGRVHIAEWRLKCKDGAYLPVEVSAKILPDGRWQGLVRNITERKRIEAALRQSQADLKRAQAVAHTGSWRLDVTRNELVWSDESYRIFGIPVGTPMTYEGFLASVHPDDRAMVEARWQAALRGQPYDVEHRVIANSEVRWLRERAELDFDQDGALRGGIGTAQDVTERREAAERLETSEARFRAIVDLSPNAIVTIDDDERIVMFNPAAEQTFDWPAAEVLGQPVEMLMPQRYRAAHAGHVRKFALSGAPSQKMGGPMDIHGLRRSGEEFPAEGGLSQVVIGGRRLMTVIVRDVSDSMRLFEEQQFLAQLGALLVTSLDAEVTLVQIGELAVQWLADTCIVDLVTEGEIRRWRVFVRDPAQQELAAALGRFELDRSKPHLSYEVLQRRQPMLVEEVTPEMLAALAQGPKHLQLLQQLAPRSLVGQPLLARGRLLGALILASRNRRYDERDLRLAGELAARAALALDNAGLLQASERANVDLRDSVARLEAAQRTIQELTALLPVCAWCRRVRDDQADGAWMPLEQYLADHTATQVTHAICPSCAERYLGQVDNAPRR